MYTVEMAATVRIEPSAHEALSAIARAKQLSLTEALSRAIEMYRREIFVSDLASDYAALREDAAGWAEELSERVEWDRTVGDGLPLNRARRSPAVRERSKKKLSSKLPASKSRRR
jgi:hypothetical protein